MWESSMSWAIRGMLYSGDVVCSLIGKTSEEEAFEGEEMLMDMVNKLSPFLEKNLNQNIYF